MTGADKVTARSIVTRAIKTGELHRPDTCSRCGKDGTPDAHHDDYSRPLDVTWLCHGCHMKEHGRRGDFHPEGGAAGTTVGFSCLPRFIERLDEHVERMERDNPGLEFTRTDALKSLLTAALTDAEESDSPR